MVRSVWNKTNATVSANVTTAPNGTTTADKIVENSTNANHYINQSVTNTNGLLTYSIYAKASERTFLYVNAFATIPNNFTYQPNAFFDLANGTIGTTSSCNASIQSVGNGWYRCVIQCTSVFPSSSATVTFYNYTATANGINSYQGDGTSGIFVWGAQLVEGVDQLPYFPTTDRLNFPRLDYTYGSCPSALLEPQRTNLVVNSGMTGGGATPTGYVSFITGSTTAVTSIKNNSVSAYRFSGTSQRAFFVQSIATTIGTTYSFSVYCESVTTTLVVNEILSGGSIVAYYKNGVSIAGTTNIEAGNFYSIVLTASVISTDIRFGIGVGSNITANIVLSMPQFEQGAYATTFILSPVSATATRIADSFSRNNIYTNGLISASGGTWFINFRFQPNAQRDNSNALRLGDTSNGFDISGSLGSYGFILAKFVSGTFTNILFSYEGKTAFVKLAIKWNGTTADVFVNGTKVVSATSFTPTTMNDLTGSNGSAVFIQQMALFPAPLTDTECAAMTTI